MNFKLFDPANDIITTNLDVPSVLKNISTSAGAAASGVWAMVLNSTTAGFIPRPDSTGTASVISTSAAFKQISNFFYGLTNYVLDAGNNTTQNSTIRVIQFSRPDLSEGLYRGSITSVFKTPTFTLSAIDIADVNSQASALGLTGKFVDVSATSNVLGTVFYDHGVIVLSYSQGATGAILGATTGGFSISSATASNTLTINSLSYKTRSILKRSVYFCRGYNKEFNYTYNPTARLSNGRILDSLSTNPATFLTTVGLYNDANELIAVAKINPAKKKSFDNEINIRVQLDF